MKSYLKCCDSLTTAGELHEEFSMVILSISSENTKKTQIKMKTHSTWTPQ